MSLTTGYLSQLGIPIGGPPVELLLPEGAAKAQVAAAPKAKAEVAAAPKAEGQQVSWVLQ